MHNGSIDIDRESQCRLLESSELLNWQPVALASTHMPASNTKGLIIEPPLAVTLSLQ